ncbi:MAG: hypothetical protein WCP62_16320, partial [Planctomycetota bacterium]
MVWKPGVGGGWGLAVWFEGPKLEVAIEDIATVIGQHNTTAAIFAEIFRVVEFAFGDSALPFGIS